VCLPVFANVLVAGLGPPAGPVMVVADGTPAKQSSPQPKDPTRADVVDAVLKSKGIATIDDLDDDGPQAPPLLTLQAHHDLVFIVELCEAQRPSKLGSLKGSHEKYEDEYSRLQASLDTELAGEGSCSFHKWEPGMGAIQNAPARPPTGGGMSMGGVGGRPSRPQSAATTRPSRPQSAMSTISRNRFAGFPGAKPEQLAPRIGAFEVSFKLVNTQSHKVYGPDLLFSKIECGHWPGGTAQLVKRAQKSLQPWLTMDIGSHSINAYAKAEAAKHQSSSPQSKQNTSPMHSATGAALPPHVCLASSLDEEGEDEPVPASASSAATAAAATAAAPPAEEPDYQPNYAANADAGASANANAAAGSQPSAAAEPSTGGSGDRPSRRAAAGAGAAAAADDYDLGAEGETEAEAEALEIALDGA